MPCSAGPSRTSPAWSAARASSRATSTCACAAVPRFIAAARPTGCGAGKARARERRSSEFDGLTTENFIPALRFGALTRFFDPVVAVTTRESHFKRRVLDRAAVQNGERVLDLACGTGTLALGVLERAPGARVTGGDGDPEILEQARTKAEKEDAEVSFDEGMSTALPYDDESFDVVLSTLFFHHLSDKSKRGSAEEIGRVLRPGGRVVVADFGRPQGPLMRAAVLPVQLVDGFANTGGNVAGALPGILAVAGLDDVEVCDRIRTPLGTIEVLTASRS
jgi:SAM-dependent methyltransferase